VLDAVLFDLDHTLLTYDQDRGAIVGTAFAAAGVGRFCSDEVLRAAADDVPAVRGLLPSRRGAGARGRTRG